MNLQTYRYLRNRKPMALELGEDYWVSNWNKFYLCRFIKVTPKGYNFLNLETSKCLFPRHIYVTKNDETKFWFPTFIMIKKVEKEQIKTAS